MKPRIYGCIDAPEGQRFLGVFVTDDGECTTVLFFGPHRDELHDRMETWLKAERAKVGLTAELVERRKAALAAARAARKAKVVETTT